MFYGEAVIEEVRERNDIVDVIGSYVRLKRQGANYVGLCPFHNEKSPSFSVSQGRQMFYCFGCGVGGNVFSFLMKYENYSFGEAIGHLADRVGYVLPQQEMTPEMKRQQDFRAKLFEANREAAKFYYACLRSTAGAAGMDYFKNRGLTDDIMKKFGLGFAGASAGLYKYLKGKGFSDDVLKQSGLVVFDGEKNSIYDKFWNRVMFPIMDQNNKVIGFGGRVMGDGKPKYLNSPETPIFNKSRNLYGLNAAKNSRSKSIIVCEGYMDVISMHQAGFTQAVASLGTAFTSGHASILRKYASDLLLIYDSDEAGIKAALRAIPICREAGLYPKIVNLKPYKDPDEFIKNLGRDEFEKRLQEASDAFYFILSAEEKNYDMSSPQGRSRFLNYVAVKLSEISDGIERETCTQAVAVRYSVDAEVLKKNIRLLLAKNEGIVPREKPRSGRSRSRQSSEETPFEKVEKLLLTYLIEEGEKVFLQVKQFVQPSDFTQGIMRQVAGALYAQFEKGVLNPAAIVNLFSEESEHEAVADIFNKKLPYVEDNESKSKAITDLCIRVKEKSFQDGNEDLAALDPIAGAREKRKQKDAIKNIVIRL